MYVRLSRTLRCCVKTAKRIVEIISPPDIPHQSSSLSPFCYEIRTGSPLTAGVEYCAICDQ